MQNWGYSFIEGGAEASVLRNDLLTQLEELEGLREKLRVRDEELRSTRRQYGECASIQTENDVGLNKGCFRVFVHFLPG